MKSAYAGHVADLRRLEAIIDDINRQLADKATRGDVRNMLDGDAHALKLFHDAAMRFEYGDVRRALSGISHRDSAVREMIPARLWDTAMRTVHGGERGRWLIHGWPKK